MSWHASRVVLRLRSPMHIGHNKIGNVNRTRPYVTGRVLWGALALRLTRNKYEGKGPATRTQQYESVGNEVHSHIAFTYFYPTTDPGGGVDLWPWGESDRFRARYLGSYPSTALTYPQHSADEGTLHEVEFISPHTLDGGRPVYLAGYIFARDGAPDWANALGRLQLGGERGYGWGRVEPEPVDDAMSAWDGKTVFDDYKIQGNGWPPVLRAARDTRLLAHTLTSGGEAPQAPPGNIQGEVEPLVGREVERQHGRFGVVFSQARICFIPGSQVKCDTCLRIDPFGVWEVAKCTDAGTAPTAV